MYLVLCIWFLSMQWINHSSLKLLKLAAFLEEFGNYLYFLFIKDFKFHVAEPTEFFKKLGANFDRKEQF